MYACNSQTHSHHIPHIVGQPVNDRVTATNKLQMFSLCGFFSYQEHNEAGWYKRHSHNNENGNHHISALEPGDTRERGYLHELTLAAVKPTQNKSEFKMKTFKLCLWAQINHIQIFVC